MVRRTSDYVTGIVVLVVFLGLFSQRPRTLEADDAHWEVVLPQPQQQHPTTTSTTTPIRQISILGERNSGTRWTSK